MRKFGLALTFAGALAVAGCSIPGVSSSTGLTEEQLAQIQALTVTACGFLPTAVSVANIVTGSNPAVVPASLIAQAVCDAVTKPQAPRGNLGAEKTASAPVTIDGKEVVVTVTGHFVR